jgi:hypothetical protein
MRRVRRSHLDYVSIDKGEKRKRRKEKTLNALNGS